MAVSAKRPSSVLRSKSQTQAIPQGDTGVVVMVPGAVHAFDADQHHADYARRRLRRGRYTSPVQFGADQPGQLQHAVDAKRDSVGQLGRALCRRAAGRPGTGLADHCSTAAGQRRPQRCVLAASSAPSVSLRVSRRCFTVWRRCAWPKAMRPQAEQFARAWPDHGQRSSGLAGQLVGVDCPGAREAG